MTGFSEDEIWFEREWRKCRVADWEAATAEEKAEAFFYFCRHYWYIKRPPRGKILFDLFEAQEDAVRLWLENRYSICLKARQIGYSTLVAAYAFWLTFFFDDRVIIMISRNENYSKKLLYHCKYGYGSLPDWMRLRGPLRTANDAAKLAFSNESWIESLPSASEPGRGDTVFLGIVDELAKLPNSVEAYAAIEPVADVGGSLIMLGTAMGEGNLLHQIWMGAQGVGNLYRQYKGLFSGWWASGRDDAWYENKKTEMQEHLLWQEYPDNWQEAFIRSGRPFFDIEALSANPVDEPRARGFLRQLPGQEIELVEQTDGVLRVWEAPMPKHTYVIGADVAQGLEHGDFSSAHVIDVRTNEVVAHWHGHVEPGPFGEDVLDKLGRWYNQALLGVEVNNHGGTTLEALKRGRYRNLYYQVRKGQKFEQKTELLGWRTTTPSKALMCDELGMAIRGQPYIPQWDEEANDFVDSAPTPRGAEALIIYDAETVAELKTFKRNEKGRLEGSPFDDRVISLAIANQMIQYAFLSHYKVKDEPPPGTMGHLVTKMLAGEKQSAKRPPIGQFAVRAPSFSSKRATRRTKSPLR